MPYKLLLADDSLTIWKVVDLVLAHENFEVKAVSDGEQALQAMKSFVPDIVLADIEMPKLNGYQLCEKIKNDIVTAQIPVMLLAGAFEPFDENYARAIGADDFIVKPFESQELISKVKALLVNFEQFKETEVKEEDFDKQQEIINKEHEAKVALSQETKEFAEEFLKGKGELSTSTAVHHLLQEIELPSKEDISEMMKVNVAQEVSKLINSDIIPYVSSSVKDSLEKTISSAKDSLEKTISENTPDIIENVMRELTSDLLESLRGEIDDAIKRIIPEIAESVIKSEIRKITTEL